MCELITVCVPRSLYSDTQSATPLLVHIVLNGRRWQVDPLREGMSRETKLVDFIRDHAGLRGTKTMCREGGCGACIVFVKRAHPQTGQDHTSGVNACLVPFLACDGWEVTTIENIGNEQHSSLHPIQERLVVYGGTQCGFCTPGMIMNMYSLVESRPNNKLEAPDIEDILDANICRCTGYRPILDAFQTFSDPNIRNYQRWDPCRKRRVSLRIRSPATRWNFPGGQDWIQVLSLQALFEAISSVSAEGKTYALIAGHTASGVKKPVQEFDVYIHIGNVPELAATSVTRNEVTLGGGVTLTQAIDVFQGSSQEVGFTYLSGLSDHLKRVANVAVRNVGTLAGNLMLKKSFPDFPSDVFLLLETVGASINVATSPNQARHITPVELISFDMTGSIILSIVFYKRPDYCFRSFKVGKRFQNSHAYVNAGFLFKMNEAKSVLERPSIVFGGISPNFVHPVATEAFLNEQNLKDVQVLLESLQILEKELKPTEDPLDASPAYRKSLAKSLFYKFVLGVVGDMAEATMQSGGLNLNYSVTRGTQEYDTDSEQWPLYQPLPKLEAISQCTGEAEYVNDILPEPGELFGAFVLTTVAKANLKMVDASEALRIPGVVSFFEAHDIPGANNYMPFAHQMEPIFVSNAVEFAGQPIGLVVAKTREIALKAAGRVNVVYENIQPPVLTFEDALKHDQQIPSGDYSVVSDDKIFTGHHSTASHAPTEVKSENLSESKPTQTIKGEFRSGSQYHFHMETQTCLCIPREDHMDVYSSTQWMDHVQSALANMLVLPSHYFNINVRRLGGGYGAKLTRSAQVACACALAAYTLNKPVRVVLDLETNMEMLGGRLPYMTKYEVGVTEEGKIVSLKANLTSDSGWSSNEVTSSYSVYTMQSCYQATGWRLRSNNVNTTTAPKTFCRAPGSTEGIAVMEYIMDHIAFVLQKDPLAIRTINLLKSGDPIFGVPGKKFSGRNLIPSMISSMTDSADLNGRKESILSFNRSNRWKKRGLSVVPMRYPVHTYSTNFSVHIIVYHSDGSVLLTHSGIEMGQGINTKVVQVVAHELSISMEKIKVKGADSILGANCTMTGGAITSEYCCFAALKACTTLKARMLPVRSKLVSPTWEKLIEECHKSNVNLCVTYRIGSRDVIPPYDVWGLTATEVEIDCLTGEYKIARVDLIEDAGKSLSPDIDIGQVSGALIMGFGLWLTEKYKFDPRTGRNLTNRTWEYKVPMAKDIPQVLNITLMKDADNPLGVLRSKATGEPPVCMSCSVLLALKHAITAARYDAGNFEWFQLDGPVTPEDIQTLSLTSESQFQL